MPLHNLDDIDERDLSEAPRLAKGPSSAGTMIAIAVAVVLLLGLLVHGSLPELSPEEIISMDGYEGEQPTRHIFNIHSLEDKTENTSSTSGQPVQTASQDSEDSQLPIAITEPLPREPMPITESSLEQQEVPPVVSAELLPEQPPIATTEPVPAIAETSVAAQEAPKVISFSTADEEKVISATATTPTIEEASDTVVVASLVAPEPVPVPVRPTTQSDNNDSQFVVDGDDNDRFLPLRSILADATSVKASPSAQSKTVLSLDSDEIVTAFERIGDWIHVGVNDGSSITGYVLESSLQPLKTKPSH